MRFLCNDKTYPYLYSLDDRSSNRSISADRRAYFSLAILMSVTSLFCVYCFRLSGKLCFGYVQLVTQAYDYRGENNREDGCHKK